MNNHKLRIFINKNFWFGQRRTIDEKIRYKLGLRDYHKLEWQVWEQLELPVNQLIRDNIQRSK